MDRAIQVRGMIEQYILYEEANLRFFQWLLERSNSEEAKALIRERIENAKRTISILEDRVHIINNGRLKSCSGCCEPLTGDELYCPSCKGELK